MLAAKIIGVVYFVCAVNLPLILAYSVGSLNNNTRIKRQNGIKGCDGFTCTTTKECIAEELKCDGKIDCRDGSDEFNDCKDLSCPGYLFTCDYGACIDANKKCNGIKDCRDNSDEANCIDTQIAANDGSNCRSDQFECNSGQCIPLENTCDGIHHCNDKSDEIKATCLNVQCPGYTFKCDYGACVNGYGRCDNIKDCVDNSDEENCGPTTPITPVEPVTPSEPGEGVCTLPSYPSNGKWSVLGDIQKSPGQRVGANTVLIFSCNDNYKLNSENNILLCYEKGWGMEIPKCIKLCEPLYKTDTVEVNCTNERKIEIPCSQATHGAIATFKCARYYEAADNTYKRFCFNGVWNQPPPQCVPVCGEKHVSAEVLIVNGKKVDRGDYPWVTALYVLSRGEHVNSCGGTMLSQRVILTAAHCVTNDYGEALPTNLFKIAVGKYYNKYKHPNDTEAQYSDIEEVIVHHKYRGDEQRYALDIAFLITKEKLAYSKVVQPICFTGLKNIKLVANTNGTVAGWGYTVAGGKPSDTLQEIETVYVDDSTCIAELPQEWSNKFFGDDKFCAGHHNKSIAVCKGDSGSGFVVPNRNSRYFVHGIVSLSRKTREGCDIQQRALYTKVAPHYDWIEEIIAKYSY